MKSVLLATAATFTFATVAQAAEITGKVGLDLTQNVEDKIVADTTIDLAVDSAYGVASIALTEDNGSIALDGYSVGTTVGSVTVAYGDQGDLMDAFSGKTEAVGGTTLTNLDDSGESFIIGTKVVSVMVGLTDVTADVTDVSHVQATTGVNFSGISFGAGIDYNLDSEEKTFLTAAEYSQGAFTLGLTGTYMMDAETVGYEADFTYSGVTTFVNGDKDDLAQNVGAGYYGDVNGMGVYAETSYNITAETITPAVGVMFAF